MSERDPSGWAEPVCKRCSVKARGPAEVRRCGDAAAMRRPIVASATSVNLNKPSSQQRWLTQCRFSWLLSLFVASFARDKAAPRSLYANSLLGNQFIFVACFDSSDFAKPLISARSVWLRHGWALHLISDSIRKEPCSAVSG